MLLFIEVVLVVLVGILFYLFRTLFWMTMSMYHIYSWSDIMGRALVHSLRFMRAKRILHKLEDFLGLDVELKLVYTSKRNAMATHRCSNGQYFPCIYITWGALKLKPEYIAAILAHELGHIKLGHHMYTMANQAKCTMAELRQNELDADRLGVELLAKSGLDPFAAWKYHVEYDGLMPNVEYSDETWDHPEPEFRRAELRRLAYECAK